MKEKLMYSIIVPIYNVEKYLRDCVDSIINQSFKNYELILVDDGSPDNCGKICDEYADKYEFIKVFHKKNGGLSDARNFGIKKATGEYLVFLDSDDYWQDKDALHNISRIIKRDDSDIVIIGTSKYFESTKKMIKTNKIKETGKSTKEFILKNNIYKACANDKIVKKSIIKENNLYFPKGYLSEDIEWCGRLLKYITKISIYSNDLYVYRQRDGSISKTVKKKHIQDIYDMLYNGMLSSKEDYYCLNFYSYEYVVVLGLISSNMCGNISSSLRNKIYELKKLLQYNLNKKVKISYLVYKLFGISLTSKILGIFICLKNKY